MVLKVAREYLPISRPIAKECRKKNILSLRGLMGSCFSQESQVSDSKDMKKLGAIRLRIQRVLLVIDTVPESSLEGLGS